MPSSSSHLRFILNPFFLVIASLFFALNVWAGQFVFYIDKAEKLGIEISIDPVSGESGVVLRAHSVLNETIPKKIKDVLIRHLKITVNGQELQKNNQPNNESIRFVGSGSLLQKQKPTNIYITLAGTTLGHIQFFDEEFTKLMSGPLNVNDIRQFQTKGASYLPTFIENHNTLARISYRPISDLHTHFGGALRPEAIIKVSLKNRLTYPTSFLDEMDIEYDESKVSGKEILLSDLNELALKKLEENMSLDPLRRKSFERMELCYKYRGPLVKAINSFADYLWELGQDYKSFGVKYVETSLSDVLKPEWLEIAHETLPEIEKALGVRIAFNVGLWRHSDPVYNADMIERVRHFKSPYIVGIDFMGHESNSNWAIEDNIKQAVSLKDEVGMDHFQIRVHSGESPYFLENTSAAIFMGATRIGHGIYSSVDDIKLAAEKGVTFEMQAVSNLTLNSSDGAVDLKDLVKFAGRLVIGTDGHGLYGTDPESELSALLSAGIESRLPDIAEYERRYVETMNAAINRLLNIPNALTVNSKLPPGRYSEEYEAKQEQIRTDRLQTFINILKTKGFDVDTLENLLSRDFVNMSPIWISGASRSSWPNISQEDQQNIIDSLDLVILNTDWSKHFVTMGLTNFGVEGEMMGLLRKQAVELGIDVKILLVGVKDPSEYISKDADVKSVDSYANIGYGTHAVLLGEKWFDTTSHMLKLLEKTKGHAVFIGGGGVIRDQIDSSDKLNLNYYLMNGPEGASTDKTPIYPEHAFKSPSELLTSLKRNGVSTRSNLVSRNKELGTNICQGLLTE